MADRYENIRRSLEMGPTPGPWTFVPPGGRNGQTNDMGRFVGAAWMSVCSFGDCTEYYPIEGSPPNRANAAHIAACDPDTIRELLAERDAAVAIVAELCSTREGMNMLAGLVCRKMDQVGEIIDSAIAAANGGGND